MHHGNEMIHEMLLAQAAVVMKKSIVCVFIEIDAEPSRVFNGRDTFFCALYYYQGILCPGTRHYTQ
jgi:hypothetical protein